MGQWSAGCSSSIARCFCHIGVGITGQQFEQLTLLLAHQRRIRQTHERFQRAPATARVTVLAQNPAQTGQGLINRRPGQFLDREAALLAVICGNAGVDERSQEVGGQWFRSRGRRWRVALQQARSLFPHRRGRARGSVDQRALPMARGS